MNHFQSTKTITASHHFTGCFLKNYHMTSLAKISCVDLPWNLAGAKCGRALRSLIERLLPCPFPARRRISRIVQFS